MRLRIATDLHDEIGSGLTQISLYSELVGRASDGQTAKWAEEAGTLARRLTDAMQDIIWMIKPGNESFVDMELRMKDFAIRMASPRGIAFEMDGSVTPLENELRIELRKDLLLLFKEIIHNAVRHANCSCITVTYGTTRTSLWLKICDDGCGFDPATVHRNNGLRNLEYRAREIQASLSLDTRPGGPTCYRIDAPLQIPPPKTTRTGRKREAS
jgi:signal transduction histidine kinase